MEMYMRIPLEVVKIETVTDRNQPPTSKVLLVAESESSNCDGESLGVREDLRLWITCEAEEELQLYPIGKQFYLELKSVE